MPPEALQKRTEALPRLAQLINKIAEKNEEVCSYLDKFNSLKNEIKVSKFKILSFFQDYPRQSRKIKLRA